MGSIGNGMESFGVSSGHTGATSIGDLLKLPTPLDSTIVEYIWIDGTMENCRSKARTVTKQVTSVDQLSKWNFDGSSTGQAPGEDSEVILVPRSIYRDPFRGGQHLLCMCECEDPHGNPLPSNTRANAVKIFSDPKVEGEAPW